MSNENEILTIAGKRVVVRYARTQEEACASCAFCSRKECHDLDCNMRDIIGESVCRYAYFVDAEQPEVDLEKLGEIARHLIAVKQHIEDMRLSEDEWSLIERIGYPERFNAKK